MTRDLAKWLRGVRPAAVPGLLLVVVGCAAGPKKPAPPVVGEPMLVVAPAAAAGAGPTVKDLRPPADKTRDMHSLWITSCDYGISTLPELPGNPTGPSTLANDMAALPGDPWRGHTVDVVHYASYLNQKRMLKSSVSGMYGGVIPYLMLKAGEDCAETKMHGGYYAATEILNFYPPIVVEMVVKIDGAVHRQRTVYSTKPPIDPHLKQPWEAAEVLQAMTKANHALLASLGTVVSPSPVATGSPPPAAAVQAKDDEGFINTNPASR
jgi:hypothetical protein